MERQCWARRRRIATYERLLGGLAGPRGVSYPRVPGMSLPNPARSRILRVTNGGLEGTETCIRFGDSSRHQSTDTTRRSGLRISHLLPPLRHWRRILGMSYALLSLLPMCFGKNLRWRTTDSLFRCIPAFPVGLPTASRCCGTDTMERSSHMPTP